MRATKKANEMVGEKPIKSGSLQVALRSVAIAAGTLVSLTAVSLNGGRALAETTSMQASDTSPSYGAGTAVAPKSTDANTVKECEQDNVASFSIRACTILLSSQALDATERVRIYKLRGRSWLTEDDPAQAAVDFSRALNLQPNDEAALRGRVKALDLQERYELAVEDWTALIAMHPKDDALYRGRGASHLGAKMFDKALADYDVSLQINPKGLDAYIGRAQVHEARGERDKAMQQFLDAIAIDPTYLPVFWERARMADRWGEREIAIENYIAVLKLNGHYANARKHLERLGVYSPY